MQLCMYVGMNMCTYVCVYVCGYVIVYVVYAFTYVGVHYVSRHVSINTCVYERARACVQDSMHAFT